MEKLLEYKCPNCNASIAFDSNTQKMKCPYCGTTVDVKEWHLQDPFHDPKDSLERATEQSPSWDTGATSSWEEEEARDMKVYSCQSCGGEIVGESTTAATSCPFCGNFVILTHQLKGDLRPEWVIPFRLDKKAAMNAWRSHIQGKMLLPRIFKDQKHIDEIKGIYVPFWLFSGVGEGDIRYRGETLRMWSDTDYDYVETKVYKISRSGSVDFQRIPVDGATKMPDDLMESIEPFDWKDAVDFQMEYLSGYFAHRYDVPMEECMDRADERAIQSVANALSETVKGYDRVTVENSNIQLARGSVAYALYPVWLLNTTWNKKQYTFAMNGQTGKFVGDLPLDKGAYWRWFVLLTFIFGAVIYGFMWLLILL